MLTKKWIRVIVTVVLFVALVRVYTKKRTRKEEKGLELDIKFPALVRGRSGAKKRIPPDYNHTTVFNDKYSFSNGKNANGSSLVQDSWRSRKFVNPVDPKVIDPEAEATIWMEITNHSAPQIEEMRALVHKRWTANREGLLKFRQQLEEFKASVLNATLTQNNTQPGQKIRYSLNRDAFANVTSEIFSFLPKESLFSKVKFPKCSVVGASGILVNSKCSEQIDNADFVFRCNLPDLKGFETDVGVKSNLTTINTISIIAKRYNFMQTLSDSKKFIRTLQDFHGYLWMPLFGLKSGLSYSMRVARLLHQSKDIPNLKLIIGNPDHFSAVQDFWRTRFLSTRISTGLYVVTLALSLCDETNLYGFWPFSRDLNLRPLKYHYYDDLDGPLAVHSFTEEFSTMLKMHKDGLLRMHFDKCS
nr:alpha-N-acetylneuraminide alpha-2,8-sialyltransferase-like [Lytechinus pictus]